jgi:Ca2+-binding RTX toxin-like protein
VSILLGDNTGSFATTAPVFIGTGTNPYSITSADFDGDGDIDLAVANQTSNNLSILLRNGTGGFSRGTTLGVGSSPYSVTVGDFNVDGDIDLAVANRVSNTVSILLGNGNGGFSAATTLAVASGPSAVTVGDFNDDGKVDLVVANRDSNDVSILINVFNRPPVREMPIDDQSKLEQIPFIFIVPADTFSDPDIGDTLTYTASLDDGSPLPPWLAFAPMTRTFSGTPPALPTTTPISVKVTATDTEGLFVSDTFDLTITPLPTLVTRGTGLPDTLAGGVGFNVIDGGGGNDSIEGGVVADTLRGGSGNDTLKGLAGVDLLDGGSGNDTIEGSNGKDTLLGGSGNDTLVGGIDDDTLTGGSGVDSFLFNSSSEGVDSITDFKVTEDKIRINNSGFDDSLSLGTLDPSAFVIGSSATDPAHRFIYNPSSGLLSFDADGSAMGSDPIAFAQLRGGLAMTSNDIIVFENTIR